MSLAAVVIGTVYLPVDGWVTFLAIAVLYAITSPFTLAGVRPRPPGEPDRREPGRPGADGEAAGRARPVPQRRAAWRHRPDRSGRSHGRPPAAKLVIEGRRRRCRRRRAPPGKS
ncbi:hypothetical protein HBB16_18390 [Pseudonocardia sp. MCCB 268]|nr:hypothetical protein [Pseudonocardia cytotoxica]